MKRLLFAAAVFFQGSLLWSAEKSLTLIQDSTLKAEPDSALVSFYFTGYGWTVDKAQKKLERTIQKFMDKISQSKVTPSETTKGEIRFKPSYQFNRDLKTLVPSDFLVSRKVTLRLDDFSQVARLMDASLSAGSFLLDQALLTVKDKNSLSEKCFNQALEEGTRRAQAMAKAAQSKIGGILTVEELFSSVQETSLLQENEFASVLAGTIHLESKEETADSTDDKTAAAPSGVVQARVRLRITFSLQ